MVAEEIRQKTVDLAFAIDEIATTHEALVEACAYAIDHIHAMIVQSQRERREAAS